jgi:hypothetical protein
LSSLFPTQKTPQCKSQFMRLNTLTFNTRKTYHRALFMEGQLLQSTLGIGERNTNTTKA